MDSVKTLLLVLVIIAGVVSAGCTDNNPPAPADPAPQPGVSIRLIGDVTGQGVILQGVPRGTIDTITFTIGLAPGIKELELQGTTIAYADAVKTELLTPLEGYRGDPPQGYWGITETIGEMGLQNLRLDYEEQMIIRINPKVPVISDQMITISVKTPQGRPLVIRCVAPSVIGENDNILRIL